MYPPPSQGYSGYPLYPQPEPRPRVTPGAVIGTLITVVLAALLLAAILFRPVKVAAPTAYQSYTAPDNAFVCLAPDGWERHEAASHAIQSIVTFQKGDVHIAIDSDLSGSMMGDIMNATSAAAQSDSPQAFIDNLPPALRAQFGVVDREMRKPAVEKMHEQERHSLELRYKHYAEKPMETLTSPLGDARCSEWTGEAEGYLSNSKVHGYRVTILGKERRTTVLCRCPESNWAILRPAFSHIIASLNNGPNS